jgi:hypothetical protein
MTNLYKASAQWASRPDDQRFLDLESLKAHVAGRRLISREATLRLDELSVDADDENVYLSGHNGAPVSFTNWSFGQLAQQVGAPAGYLRKLPAQVAKLNLLVGLNGERGTEQSKLLYSYGQDEQRGELRGMTGPMYGRIWDEQVVDAVQHMNADGRWTVPTPFKKPGDTAPSTFIVDKHSTTLYASDRDVFMFLVDEDRAIEVDDQAYFRGFYVWNSEVGRATFGISTFLYSYVCANRIIWNATDVQELRIRHTALAPDRFIEQALPALNAMSDASPQPIINAIKEAKATKIADTVAGVEKWLADKGIGKLESKVGIELAARGGDTGASGDPTNVWDVVQGLTALARDIPHADERITFERQVGALLTAAR